MLAPEYIYYADFLDKQESSNLWDQIINADILVQRPSPLWGKLEPRLTTFFAKNGITYTYSRKSLTGTGIPHWLKSLFNKIGKQSGCQPNFVLINAYLDPQTHYIPPHADDEPETGPSTENRIVSSLTLLYGDGHPRLFRFRYKETRQIVPLPHQIYLENGSLLVMHGLTQSYFLHEIPKTRREDMAPRINRTFRTIV